MFGLSAGFVVKALVKSNILLYNISYDIYTLFLRVFSKTRNNKNTE